MELFELVEALADTELFKHKIPDISTFIQATVNFPEQKEALWEIALKDLHDPEMKGIYHLLKKNCTNSMFELLDHFIKRERGFGPRMMTTVPVWSERALKIRKLLSETKKLKTLNEEYSGEIKRISECNLILNGNATQERMGKL